MCIRDRYNMEVNRKTVKRNLITLIDFGYDIEYSETRRIIKDKYGNKSESTILSDFYLNRDFTNGELRLIIDSLIFSKHIPSKPVSYTHLDVYKRQGEWKIKINC